MADEQKKPQLPQKVVDFIKQANEAIKTLTEENEALTQKLAEAKEAAEKVASEQPEVDEKSVKVTEKLANDTADYLVRERVIKPSDRGVFAEGLRDSTQAHNMIRNLATKLAEAEAPPQLGKPTKTKTAGDKVESADSLFTTLLNEAHGRG